MAGTVPAGPVTCPECGRTVKGYKSIDYVPGARPSKRIVVYPHRHKHADGTPDCQGRYRIAAVSTVTEPR